MADRRLVFALAAAVVLGACREKAPAAPESPEPQLLAHRASDRGRDRDREQERIRNRRRREECLQQLAEDTKRLKPHSGPVALTAPEGEVVTRVGIRAGHTCWFTPEGATGTFTIEAGDDPCYVVAGLGTRQATVARVARGRHCRPVGLLRYAHAPAPVDDGEQGGGDTGGGDTGGGDTGGGDTGGGQTGPGALVICSATSSPVGEAWFDYDLGWQLSLSTTANACSDPITLEAGEYELTQRPQWGFTLASVASDPAGSANVRDLSQGIVGVTVVPGATTRVTFTSDVQM